MGGLGFGLMYLPAMDILCKYFDRYLREAAKIILYLWSTTKPPPPLLLELSGHSSFPEQDVSNGSGSITIQFSI